MLLRSYPLLLVLLLLAACQSVQPAPAPDVSRLAAKVGLEEWEADQQARAVAKAGIPSSTPELDTLVAMVSRVTPDLRLDEVLHPASEQLPALRFRSGDLLDILVYDRPEFSGEKRVLQDGSIYLFLLGGVRVAGSSQDEATETLRKRLAAASLLKHPEVSVSLKERAPAFVQVHGRVQRAGTRELPADTLLSAYDLLTRVEGFVADADGSRLTLVRHVPDGQRCYHFSYGELVTAHLGGRELWLEPGDQLVVPRLPDVFVAGFVAKPGPQPLRSGSTVASILARAGGMTEQADGRALRLLNGTSVRAAGLEATLRPSEVVFVPRRKRVYLVGPGVVTNGPLDLPRSGLTLVQAIAEAGWFTAHAKLDAVEIIRFENDKQERILAPVDEILAGKRNDAEFRLRPGDLVFVPESFW